MPCIITLRLINIRNTVDPQHLKDGRRAEAGQSMFIVFCTGSNDAADVAASKAEGRLRLDMPKPATIADGLQGRMGDLTWPVIRDKTDAVVTVRFARHCHVCELAPDTMGELTCSYCWRPDLKGSVAHGQHDCH